jgi:hypothetical protein
MRRIREIFLTQYIGAIVIGMLVVQTIGGVISLLNAACYLVHAGSGISLDHAICVTGISMVQVAAVGDHHRSICGRFLLVVRVALSNRRENTGH